MFCSELLKEKLTVLLMHWVRDNYIYVKYIMSENIITNGSIEFRSTDSNTGIVYASNNYPSSITSNHNGSFTMKSNYLNLYSASVINTARGYLNNGLFALGYPETFDVINADTGKSITFKNNIPSNWVNPDTTSNYKPVSSYQDI